MVSDSKNSRNVQGRGGSGVGGLPTAIPPASRKIVQNVREVVGESYTDSEIYAVLLDCNMDPDDAVQRLFSQDAFHEVKSKRERRKEMKETQESKAVGASNRGARLGTHVASYVSIENNYNELGKSAYKREIASVAQSVSSSPSYVYRATGKIINEQPSTLSNFFNADNRGQSIGTGDTISSSVQPSLGIQPAWRGVARGHLSMADIVRRGRPENRGSQMSTEISYMSQHAASTNSSLYCFKSSQTVSSSESKKHQDLHYSHPSSLSEMIHESVMTTSQQDFDNEWPVIDNLTVASGSFVLDTSADRDIGVFSNRSCIHSDTTKISRNSQSNKPQVSEKVPDSQILNSANGSASASSKQTFSNGAGGALHGDLLLETSSYDSHLHVSKPQEVLGIGNGSDLPIPTQSASLNDNVILAVSSVAENLKQLSIGEEPAMPPPENNSSVVLPNYLQAFASDCSHLSFGTYKSGVASASSMPIASNPLKSNLEVPAAVDGSSAVHLDIRKSGQLDDEHHGFTHDTPAVTADARNCDLLISSQAELRVQDAPEATYVHPYISTLPVSDSNIKSIHQSSPKSSLMINPNARNLPPSLSEMVLNSSSDSLPQASSQTLPGSNLAHGALHPQLLLRHFYSQPKLALGESANMIGYPSMPQNRTYVPSALQHAYQDTNTFHDSLAGMNYNLSQYRTGAPINSLPVSNDSTSAYGSFVGNSANIPGSLLHDLSTSSTATALGYNDLLQYQYKDGNGLTHFQQYQNNRSSTWDSGIVSQTMVLQDGAYYSLLGENSQHSGYQHDQQASHHYKPLGYPNLYYSQMDHTRASAAKPW